MTFVIAGSDIPCGPFLLKMLALRVNGEPASDDSRSASGATNKAPRIRLHCGVLRGGQALFDVAGGRGGTNTGTIILALDSVSDLERAADAWHARP
jgi:hypothetical protein